MTMSMHGAGVAKLEADSAEFYEKRLEEAYGSFPQQQGLDALGVKEALHDTDVVSTSTMNEDHEYVEVPQLAPVTTYDWLNRGFYDGHFEGRTVRHFMDLPGLTPGQEVAKAAGLLAAEGGIIAIDYPDSDGDYEGRVVDWLAQQGVGVEASETLGTQTYVVGEVWLKDGLDPDRPTMEMHEAFQAMRDQGVITPEDEITGASYARTIDPEQVRAELAEPYAKAFEVLNDHPCRQGLTPEELIEVAADPNSAKIIYREAGELSTMVIFGNDLSSYPWVNERAYQQIFPEKMATKQVIYFPAIATDPERRGAENAGKVIDLIAKMTLFGNNEIVVAFDHCDDNFWLPGYIEGQINATDESGIRFRDIGKQVYRALVLSSKAD